MSAGDLCFCTLALGGGYQKLVRQLARDLAEFAPGVSLFVLSDNCRNLEGAANVRAVRHCQRSVLGFNDKLAAINNALARFRVVICIDADSRILSPVRLDAEKFKPGIRGRFVKRWADEQDSFDRSPKAPWWQKQHLRMMTLLSEKENLANEGRYVPYIVEGLFSVTRGADSSAQRFLRKWGELAEFCEKQKLWRYEGCTMGLAANLTSFSVEQYEFEEIDIFEELLSRRDLASGKIAPDKYAALKATIDRHKGSGAKTLFGRGTAHAIRRLLRYFRIKMFGLHLVD